MPLLDETGLGSSSTTTVQVLPHACQAHHMVRMGRMELGFQFEGGKVVRLDQMVLGSHQQRRSFLVKRKGGHMIFQTLDPLSIYFGLEDSEDER